MEASEVLKAEEEAKAAQGDETLPTNAARQPGQINDGETATA